MKIEAFFSGIKAADEAVSKLKQSGFNKAFVDINNPYFNEELANATSISSLATESITNDVYRRNQLRDTSNPEFSNIDKVGEKHTMHYKVIVETNKENKDKLKQIIKDMGGNFNTPNVNHNKDHYDLSEYTLHNIVRRL